MKKILVLAACRHSFLLERHRRTRSLSATTILLFPRRERCLQDVGRRVFRLRDMDRNGGTPTTLSFIYCVDLGHNISLNGVSVRRPQLEWLRQRSGYPQCGADRLASGSLRHRGKSHRCICLQAAIWHVIYDTGSMPTVGASHPRGGHAVQRNAGRPQLKFRRGAISPTTSGYPRGPMTYRDRSRRPSSRAGTMVLLGRTGRWPVGAEAVPQVTNNTTHGKGPSARNRRPFLFLHRSL